MTASDTSASSSGKARGSVGIQNSTYETNTTWKITYLLVILYEKSTLL